MKTRLFFVCLAGLLLAVSCGKNAVTIKGHVTDAKDELLELFVNTTPQKLIDTVRLDSLGTFSFKYDFKKNPFPVFFTLSISDKPLASLLLEPGEKVTVETGLKNPAAYQVSGSEGSQLLKELNDKMLKTAISVDSTVRILNKTGDASENSEQSQKTRRDLAAIFTRHKRDLIKFVIKNSKSYAAYTAMYQTLPSGIGVFGKEDDALYFKLLADSLEKKYPRSPYVLQLRDDYNRLINSNAVRNLINSAEETAIPDVKLPDATGTQVSLLSLKGKVVLLNFWSSKDKVTALNNNELLPVYEKYKSEGFEIYQVSLDEDRESWLQTINMQKLPWINVCDFTGTGTYPLKLYNITKLPANYLISRSCEIIGRDLFGEKLEEKIKENI
ncbi:MAG: TlpA family protein disulfide reductase [Prevotellaceae bacterium]|jgi:peroxiredoxin|nr:TlpA family protein disulfide reductase [Prevotellaceae bacterium]